MFEGKTLMITGGTGSFGEAVLNRFLHTDIKEIRIFSRDEKKQDDMRHRYQSDKIKYYIGDVREKDSVRGALYNVDYLFHAAALEGGREQVAAQDLLGFARPEVCAVDPGRSPAAAHQRPRPPIGGLLVGALPTCDTRPHRHRHRSPRNRA